jgi:hypothetical protein
MEDSAGLLWTRLDPAARVVAGESVVVVTE